MELHALVGVGSVSVHITGIYEMHVVERVRSITEIS